MQERARRSNLHCIYAADEKHQKRVVTNQTINLFP